jgi:gamma-glutamylcyclotransferase (GGCT)/AIG2-like uncharacterized protein YtfP
VTLVFVYGTLMQGERYHDLLATSPRVASARTAAGFQLHDLGPYPAMVRGHAQVFGELYHVSDEVLAALDELEDHPTLYRRETIALDEGGEAHAYVYLGALDGAAVIGSGDWRQR